jgi:hypothetical protein
MQTLYALDLTGRKGTDSLWRRTPGQSSPSHHSNALECGTTDPELPADGFASPFGFWFAAAPSWPPAAPRLRVEFVNPERPGLQHDFAQERSASESCRTVRARPKAPLGRVRAARATLPLFLEVDANVARISVDADTWSAVGDTVLFAVAQYWRFDAINRTLDELSDWARQDLSANSSFRNVVRRARSGKLRARRRELQSLILDLPDFEGPLANPRGHLATGSAVRLYRKLCIRLGLLRFRREIDERIEVVESIFDSLAQSLDNFQSLAFQIALELIIVAVLLLDIGLYLVDAVAK